MVILAWCVVSFFLLVGLVGVVVPLLPGTTLILLGTVIFKLIVPEAISWTVVGFIAAIWALSILADFAGVVIGARLFGGSKWGMTGAGGGAVIGAFISLPAILFGTALGAMAAEKWGAGKSSRAALMAGFGATLGFFLSIVLRLICAVFMIVVFLTAALSSS